MSHTAAHVTMLQRSPTYVMTLPQHDPLANLIRRVLPQRAALRLVRWKNILISMGLYQLSRLAPDRMRRHAARGSSEGPAARL